MCVFCILILSCVPSSRLLYTLFRSQQYPGQDVDESKPRGVDRQPVRHVTRVDEVSLDIVRQAPSPPSPAAVCSVSAATESHNERKRGGPHVCLVFLCNYVLYAFLSLFADVISNTIIPTSCMLSELLRRRYLSFCTRIIVQDDGFCLVCILCALFKPFRTFFCSQ